MDDCTVVCSLWDGSPGGTSNCVEYAERGGRQRINIDPRKGLSFIEKKEQAVVFLHSPPDVPSWDSAQGLVSEVFEEILLGMNRVNYPDASIKSILEGIERDRRIAESLDRRRLAFFARPR